MLNRIYSMRGLSRELNQLENGCDCTFYLEFNGLHLRVVMSDDKYSISLQKEEYGRNLVFKENLTLEQAKKTIKEMIQ